MKINIEPIVSYPKSGVAIESYLAADNLTDHAVIRWRLVNEDNGEIAKGDIQVEGEDYVAWRGSNEEAENIILAKTGFVKLAEVVEVIEPVIEPEVEG